MVPVVPMLQDGSARSDLPAGGQEELGGASHSERMMADMMKMLANLTIQNQQLLQQHLQLQQTTAAADDRGVQQQTAGAADTAGYSSRWRPEMVAAYKSPVGLEMDTSSIAVVPS